MAPRTGIEPATSSVTGWCSNHLNYRSKCGKQLYVSAAHTVQSHSVSNPYQNECFVRCIVCRFAGSVMAIRVASSSVCCILPITESMVSKRCSSCLRVSQVLRRPFRLVLRRCRVLAMVFSPPVPSVTGHTIQLCCARPILSVL